MDHNEQDSEDREGRPLSLACVGCGRTLQQIAGWARMSIADQWL